MLTLIDEFTREYLAIRVGRILSLEDVLDTLADLFTIRTVPQHIRSDNGSEFTSEKVRDELLNMGIFDTLFEAKILIERWRREYNQVIPHSSLGYRPPAPEAVHLDIQKIKLNFVN